MAMVAVVGAAGTAQSAVQVSGQDRMYLQMAHQSNLAEITDGKLAQAKGQSEEVKSLGAMMVADHTKLDAALSKVAAAKKVTLPKAPNAEQRSMHAKLTKAAAGEFDAMYVAGQLAGHSKAKALGTKELSAGTDAAVKGNARSAAPVIERHHEEFMAQADQMGLPGSVDAGISGAAAPQHSGLAAGLIAVGVLLLAGGGGVTVRRRFIR